MDSETTHIRWVSLAIGVLAGIGLAFQVALTRTFSLIFEYNFVFLVVSLAVLGLGIGAALAYIGRGTAKDRLTLPTLLLTIAFPLVALLLAGVTSSQLTLFTVLVSLVPFLLIGWINALVYRRYAARSNLIYSADLMGAVLGLALSPLLMILVGPFGAIIALGAFAALAALFLAIPTWELRAPLVALLVALVLTIGNRITGLIAYDPNNLTDAPPDKTMVHLLKNPALEAKVTDTKWGAFAQVDVVETKDPSARFVFTDAGAGSIMLRETTDLEWLRRETSFLPFEVGPVTDTLIIGAGAGYDLVQARYAGAENITAVEINPAIVDITREYADYNGNILDQPGVTTVVTDGRNFIDRTGASFDLIYLNLVYSQAARPGTSALAESYAFTIEAMDAYLKHLSDEGRIGVVAHSGLHGVRLMMTAVQTLQNQGSTVQDALKHVALVRSPNPVDPTITPSVLIIGKQAWTEEQAQAFAAAAESHGLEALYIPFVFEESVKVLLNGSMTLDEYFATVTDFNIFPTTDKRPFFYHLNPGLPEAIKNLLVWSALLTLGYFIVAAALQPKNPRHEWTRITLMVYFALLGAGFLLAEVALLQYFRLLLGDPVLAFAAALGALLLGAGLGSRFGGRFGAERLGRVIGLVALGITVWLAAATIIYPSVVDAALPLELFPRGIVTVIALLPLGFLMGIPFPGGLRAATAADPAGVPLFWGMNALAATLGATLATVIALLAGFQAALLLGAGLYLLAAVIGFTVWKRVVA
jgi:hypothetical protein